MSERTQAPDTPSTPPLEQPGSTGRIAPAVPVSKPWWKFSRKTLTMSLAGTLTIVLTAGLLFQIFRGDGGAGAHDGTAHAEDGATSKRYLARVNNELVTWDEVAQEAMLRYGGEVLEQIVNRKIVQQACDARGITVTEAEVTAEIQNIADKFKMPVQTWYEMLQTERNLTPVQYRRDVIWPMLALKKLAGERISISDADLNKAFIRDFGPKVQAKVIMLDNHRRAIEVAEKLRNDPSQFEELAQTYSVEPNSRALGGSIPPIHRYYSNPRLEKVAFGLKEDEISSIVQVGLNRYVIVKCEGFTEPIVTEINDVKPELTARLQEERLQEAVAKVFDKLKRDAQVDNYLTNTSTTKIKPTSGKQNDGSVAPAGGSYPQPATSGKPSNAGLSSVN